MQKLLLVVACVTSPSLAGREQHSEASWDPSLKTLASLLASNILASGFNAGAARVPRAQQANTLSSRLGSPKLEAAEVEETLSSLTSAAAAVQGATNGEKLALRKQLFAGALAVAVALQPPNVAHAGDIAAGAQVFNSNCVACHRGGQNVILADKTLQKEALEEYLDGGFSEASIVKQVTNGKNGMPAFGGRLGDGEISNVAAYVYDQATNAKWDED